MISTSGTYLAAISAKRFISVAVIEKLPAASTPTVCAFGWREEVDDGADCVPQGFDCPLGLAAQQCLELCESVLDRVEVGPVGRQEEERCASRLDRSRTPAALCAGKLSMMTTSPGESVGTSTCST